jgi:hypothetical protein
MEMLYLQPTSSYTIVEKLVEKLVGQAEASHNSALVWYTTTTRYRSSTVPSRHALQPLHEARQSVPTA